jgi:sugar transferase (PEP-CTERM/EpsH1 system associated)
MQDLLFLSHCLPYPPNKGEKIRAWHILRHFAESHRIHLGCLANNKDDYHRSDELHQVCASVGCFRIYPKLQKARALLNLRTGRPLTIDFFHHRKLMRWVSETLSRYAIERVFVFSSAMANYVSQSGACYCVLDMVDVDSEKWKAYASHHRWPLRGLYSREAAALLAYERHLVTEFDMTLFVSEAEASRFTALAPESRGHVGWVENGVDLETFSPNANLPSPYSDGNQNIVFTGTMDYWPNVDAVIHFVKQVFPLVRMRRPAVDFHIVGANPYRTVSQLGEIPGVTVTGRVPDVRPFVAHADVAVAPLRIARGIQNKVLEAMAMARPIVLTSDALEGIHALPGRDLLVTDTPEDMATSIIEILEGLHPNLGAHARAAVQRHHCWAHTLQYLDNLFQVRVQMDGNTSARSEQGIGIGAE